MQMIEPSPKVSVCVLAYNHEKYIRQCLQSIVDQEVDFDFEVIVGDDCSTDGTRMILQEFVERYPTLIKVVQNKRNSGYFKNYMNTHSMATGMYVAHCDGDDYWYPGKLKWQAGFLDNNPDVAATFSNAYSNGKLKHKQKECGFFHYEKILERVYTNFLCVHSSIMERRRNVNLADDNDGKVFDFECYWIKHKNALFYIDPIPRVHYETTPAGISRQKEFIEQLRPSLSRFENRGLNARTLERIRFDYKMLKYFSDPIRNARPSIRKAISFRYGLGWIVRLIAPTNIYHAIKLLRHPELKQKTEEQAT